MALDQLPVYATAALILAMIGSQVCRRSFDPFAPIWLFLVGYAQLYVVQAISYRGWALRARGPELVMWANLRALWALAWFLCVYHSGIGRRLARKLPAAPRGWSPGLIGAVAPMMMAWGLACAGLLAQTSTEVNPAAEESILRQFPIMLLVGGVLLLVTGRQRDRPRPVFTAAGLVVVVGYLLLWMFNGKRSHSMIAVLAGLCAYYAPRLRRPSLGVMGLTGVVCVLAVTLALGWRDNRRHETTTSGFIQFLGEFDPNSVLVNMNLKERDDDASLAGSASKETEEYGGFLLMMATVPLLSDYDYGASYLRIVSTYIPRKLLWQDKPIFGREAWVNAWIAGSEQVRTTKFTGPSIGILGAGQLNGGPLGTALMLAVVATIMRAGYEYYRFYADRPWAQAWWSLTYFNAWMLTANDDPSVFFYYMYGHAIFAPMLLLWAIHKLGVGGRVAA